MNNIELAQKAKEIATKYKTLYVMGCFGAPMTDVNKVRYCANHKYNKDASRQKMIKAASADTFGFDCVNLIKGILWGWKGDKKKTYGGAIYATNNIPDIGADAMITKCLNVSKEFKNIEIGEAVWCKGHIGIYIGDGLAVECSPKWANKVQITACNCNVKGYHRRNWTKHGKLPYIKYVSAESTSKDGFFPERGYFMKGDKSPNVAKIATFMRNTFPRYTNKKALGDVYGPYLMAAIKEFQKRTGLKADGYFGPQTLKMLESFGFKK